MRPYPLLLRIDMHTICIGASLSEPHIFDLPIVAVSHVLQCTLHACMHERRLVFVPLHDHTMLSTACFHSSTSALFNYSTIIMVSVQLTDGK